jgi:hypothetical protein
MTAFRASCPASGMAAYSPYHTQAAVSFRPHSGNGPRFVPPYRPQEPSPRRLKADVASQRRHVTCAPKGNVLSRPERLVSGLRRHHAADVSCRFEGCGLPFDTYSMPVQAMISVVQRAALRLWILRHATAGSAASLALVRGGVLPPRSGSQPSTSICQRSLCMALRFD